MDDSREKKMGEPVIEFSDPVKKPLEELRASDVPRGMDPYDCALGQDAK